MSTYQLEKEIEKGNLEFVKNFDYNELINGDPYVYYIILRKAIFLDGTRCSNEYREILWHLIKCGRDEHFKLNAEVPLLVHALLQRSSYEIICELIKRGCDVNTVSDEGFTPLVYALLENCDKKIVYELISNGADVNYRDREGITPIFSISNFMNPEVIKMCINAGADITEHYKDGRNVLLLNLCNCVVNGRCYVLKEVVHIFINKGVNLKDIDKKGNNILHHSNCRYLVYLATRYGVSIESKNDLGRTPLMEAIERSQMSKLDYFISIGANINCVDLDLNTPLHLMFQPIKFYENCTSILYHGANLFARNLANDTPLDVLFSTRYDSGPSSIQKDVFKYILLFDENKLNVAEGIYKKFTLIRPAAKAFDDFITDCRQELDKMKSTYIKDDLTFYEFCVLRKFYKNKCLDISVDEFIYSDEETQQLFPIYKGLIIVRINDNRYKKGALVLRKSFDQITFRPTQNAEFNFDVELNYDCLHYVSRYLNHKDMYNLFSASISDSLNI